MEKNHLIALDIDGTLLNDQHELTEKTQKMVRAAYNKGYHIALASGRGPSSVFPIMEKLGIEGPMISHNGGVIVHSADRSIMYQIGFTASELEDVFSYCRDSQIHFDANTVFNVYVEKINEESKSFYRTFFLKPRQISNLSALDDMVLKTTLMGNDQQLTQATEYLSRFSEKFHVVRSGYEFVDIMHEKAVKAIALQKLCETLKVPMKQVTAVGNYYNDTQMLQIAGTGLAVDNAPQKVKDLVDGVIPSNNEEGVATWLEKKLKGNKSFSECP